MNFKVTTKADKAKVVAYIEKLPEGKSYNIAITQKKEVRTLPQNKLYWLWIACISDETGNDKENLHEFFKMKYLDGKFVELFSESFWMNGSTKELDTKQFTHYLEAIQVFASSELGVILPNPEDLYFGDFLEKYKNYIQ